MKIHCQICKKETKAKNYWQKFCSVKCKMLAYSIKELKKIGYKITEK